MADWSKDLDQALATGDPEVMTAMLGRVPKDVLQQAMPYLAHMAKTSQAEGRVDEALTYLNHLIQAKPGQAGRYAERARVLAMLGRHVEALADARHAAALAPDDALLKEQAAALEALVQRGPEHGTPEHKAPQSAAGTPPHVRFDPAWFANPAIAPDGDRFRVDGLRQHLWRYSGQMAPRNAIARLEDPAWQAAWDGALGAMNGARVVFRGSELGVFGLRALHHGAAHALCIESHALEARIATGMLQKHFLGPWHALHGDAVQAWSEQERSDSFDAFAGAIDVALAADAPPASEACNYFVFPNIDHTLLGTGMLRALREHCERTGRAPARVVPAKARVYAMGVQWAYPGAGFALDPLERLRWSLYPQALESGPESYTALTEPVLAGEIDFAHFEPGTWNLALPIVAGGTVNAIIYWFELDLGATSISNAPGSALRCIRPAIQYTDGLEVDAGGHVNASVKVEEGRLYFETRPAPVMPRGPALPAWYAPMLCDAHRNEAYRNAIGEAVAAHPEQAVLNIGAGCALLPMMAAQAGARAVTGCESDPALLAAGRAIVELNAMAGVIRLVGKDCRKLAVPEDLPQRAGLALFDMFDCSLIGEGILHFLAHAREHLLTPDAVFLPARGRIRAMLVEYWLDTILDIDASLLNPYRASPAFVNVDAATLDYRALSAPFEVFSFDFASAGPAPQENRLQLTATAAGTVGAVLFWFDLGLDGESELSNDPAAAKALHWKHGLQCLPTVRVEEGGAVPLVASHDGSSLQFQWVREALAVEALSKTPRYDPRWLAASSDIEQQTRSLMQHCAQHPEEYAKVAEIAMRFAIAPAAHGLDPVIAQRFATLLLNA